jgi:hypothetical protein
MPQEKIDDIYQELDALIKYNGFVVARKHGSYDRRGLDSESEKQFVVCRMAQ